MTDSRQPIPNRSARPFVWRHLLPPAMALVLAMGGCAVAPATLQLTDHPVALENNAIWSSRDAGAISMDQLMDQLVASRVVYVGESHTNPAHHTIQLDVIKALDRRWDRLSIGMEMFDYTYQPVLDRWVAGELDEEAFLAQTHWYANWRYRFDLYRDILEYAKEKKIRIIGLNVPFHIPPKIRVGGLKSLAANDARHLPQTIDTGNADHRSYLEEIYKQHRFGKRGRFETFYEAQCTWEDAMASKVAQHLGDGRMVVIAGNGHIYRKFGIPDRAFARTRAPFATVYLAPVGSQAEPQWADYLWATAKAPKRRMPRP